MGNSNSLKIKKVPENYTSVTPWIISPSSEKLIEFKNENEVVIYVVVRIGNALVMLFDSSEDWNPTPGFEFVCGRR